MDAHKQPTTKQPASAPATPRGVRAAAWGVRGAFALVFAVNVQCALAFVAQPAAYAPAYELSGAAGTAAVQGIGVAFLMWNATYPAVIAQPRRFRSLAVVVLVQQAIGLVGESCVRAGLPVGHDLLAANIERFIAFDAVGLALMARRRAEERAVAEAAATRQRGQGRVRRERRRPRRIGKDGADAEAGSGDRSSAASTPNSTYNGNEFEEIYRYITAIHLSEPEKTHEPALQHTFGKISNRNHVYITDQRGFSMA